MDTNSFCYVCRQPATTKEHVPPKCFFEDPFHHNLTWVPSCSVHNNDNSKDVEYARTVVAIARQTNEVARKIGSGKVYRMFLRRPKLSEWIYSSAVPLIVDGQETVAYNVDLKRFRKVMEAIAYGIYFHHFGKTYFGSWWFYSPTMVSIESLKGGSNEKLNEFADAFRNLPIETVPTVHPEVFQFGYHLKNENELTLKFLFYEGFEIGARGVPAFKTLKIPSTGF